MFRYDPDSDGKEAKDLFDKLYKDIKFDRNLYKKLHGFRTDWSRKSVEYSEFLGGNLLGVQAIRFSSRDDDMLMSDIFNVNSEVVYTNILKLPDIDSKWIISTNPVLQTMTYTMHRFILDGKMGNKLDDALRECYYIFAYKVLGSLIAHYFKYNTTPAIARATYEKLSNRFLIKKLGTWNKVIEHRAKDVIPPKGLHTDKLKTYTSDDSVKILNDLQGRLRAIIKNIYLIFIDVKDSSGGIKATSMIENIGDSEESTKSLSDRPDKYISRLKEVIGNPVNLIDDDLVYLVTKFVKTSDADIIKNTLHSLSDTYDPKSKSSVYLEYLILKTIAYVNTKGIRGEYRSDLVHIVEHMKGYWSSGSVKDKHVNIVKDVVGKSVKVSTKRRTKWVLASNTLAVIVYLFIRSVK